MRRRVESERQEKTNDEIAYLYCYLDRELSQSLIQQGSVSKSQRLFRS